MVAYTPSVSSGNNGTNLVTNVGNFNVPQSAYDLEVFNRKAQQYSQDWWSDITSAPGYSALDGATPEAAKRTEFNDRVSRTYGGETGLFTPEEMAAISAQSLPEGIDRALAFKALEKSYGSGTADSIADAVGVEAQRQAKSNRGFFQNAVKTVVPLGIGAGLSALGGAAFAPSMFAASAPAATGISAGGGYTGGLGSVLGNFATDAALTGAVKGGIGGLVSGGDFSSALKGAALGGLTGGYGDAIGTGLGFTGSNLQGFTGALQGASGGLAQGDLKSAAMGALLGGGSSYLQSGGSIPGLGSVAGSPVSSTVAGPTQGSGILGSVTKATSGLGNLTGTTGGQGMNLGSLLSAGGDVYGYFQGKNDLEDIQKMLAEQSGRAEAQYSPYAQAGQDALASLQAPDFEALQADPGYQFQLQQGNQALERSLAAQGLGQSGAALKAAQEYGQGLASQTYNDFFNRQSQIANLGYGAAGGLGSIYSNLGNVQAAAELERMNQRNNMLSGLGGLFG